MDSITCIALVSIWSYLYRIKLLFKSKTKNLMISMVLRNKHWKILYVLLKNTWNISPSHFEEISSISIVYNSAFNIYFPYYLYLYLFLILLRRLLLIIGVQVSRVVIVIDTLCSRVRGLTFVSVFAPFSLIYKTTINPILRYSEDLFW